VQRYRQRVGQHAQPWVDLVRKRVALARMSVKNLAESAG
jgi:hypothetical protein